MGIGHGLALCYVTYVTHVYIYVPAPGRLLPGFIDITCILNDKKISSKISHFFAFRLLTKRWKCSLYSQNFVLICYAKKVKFSRKKMRKRLGFCGLFSRNIVKTFFAKFCIVSAIFIFAKKCEISRKGCEMQIFFANVFVRCKF